MKVLVACESSGTVREAFRKLGHAAWSCDLQPADDGSVYHCEGDVRDILDANWDLVIAHPPCTDLAVSGARHFAAKRADGRQWASMEFFMLFARLTETYGILRWAIENPVGIMSTAYRKPDQIIQPYEYGHPESKKTCLWLQGLPLLRPTAILEKPARGYWDNQTPSGQNKLGPSPDRWKVRSKTYQGIADAMAAQWGGKE